MAMLFGEEDKPMVAFHVVYRIAGDSTWYAAGNLHGYDTIEEARSAGAKERERRESGKYGPDRVTELGFYERKVTVRQVE